MESEYCVTLSIDRGAIIVALQNTRSLSRPHDDALIAANQIRPLVERNLEAIQSLRLPNLYLIASSKT